MVTVRSFSNEPKMVGLYSRDINDSYALGRKLALLIGLFMGVVTMCMYVSDQNELPSCGVGNNILLISQPPAL